MFRRLYTVTLSGVISLSLAAVMTGCSVNSDPKKSPLEGVDQAILDIRPDTEASIRSVVLDHYIGGQKSRSPEIVRSAFHPDSIMLHPLPNADGTPLRRWLDMHTTVTEWAEQGDTNLDISDFQILSMDVVDDRMAFVILKVGERVYDGLTLLKIDDAWIIASKVYILQ